MSLHSYESRDRLEVHVQLATKSKILSWSSAAFGAEPNTHMIWLPGAFRHAAVLNRAVVDAAVRLGLAVGSKSASAAASRVSTTSIPTYQEHQISQFDEPICEGGT